MTERGWKHPSEEGNARAAKICPSRTPRRVAGFPNHLNFHGPGSDRVEILHVVSGAHDFDRFPGRRTDSAAPPKLRACSSSA
jgi:hypothetical protein